METELDWYKEIYNENRLLAICYRDLHKCLYWKYKIAKKRLREQLNFQSSLLNYFLQILPKDVQSSELNTQLEYISAKMEKIKVYESSIYSLQINNELRNIFNINEPFDVHERFGVFIQLLHFFSKEIFFLQAQLEKCNQNTVCDQDFRTKKFIEGVLRQCEKSLGDRKAAMNQNAGVENYNKELQSKLNEAEKDLQKKEKTYQKLFNKNAKTIKKQKKKAKDREEIISSLKREIDILKQQQMLLNSNRHPLETNSDYNAQIMNLSNKLLKNQEIFDQKIRELESERNSLVSKYETEIKKLHSEYQTAPNQLNLIQSLKTEKKVCIEKYEKEISDLRNELLVLKNNKNSIDSQTESIEAKFKNAESEIVLLKQEIKQINERHNFEVQRLTEFHEKKLREAEKKVINDIIKRKIDINPRKSANATQDSVTACIEHVLIIDKLQSTINKYEAKIDTLNEQIKANKDFYQSEYEKYQSKIRDLQTIITNLNIENTKLKTNIQTSSTNLNPINQQFISTKSYKNSQNQNYSALQVNQDPKIFQDRSPSVELHDEKPQDAHKIVSTPKNMNLDPKSESSNKNAQNIIQDKLKLIKDTDMTKNTNKPEIVLNTGENVPFHVFDHINSDSKNDRSLKEKINQKTNHEENKYLQNEQFKEIINSKLNESHHMFTPNNQYVPKFTKKTELKSSKNLKKKNMFGAITASKRKKKVAKGKSDIENSDLRKDLDFIKIPKNVDGPLAKKNTQQTSKKPESNKIQYQASKDIMQPHNSSIFGLSGQGFNFNSDYTIKSEVDQDMLMNIKKTAENTMKTKTKSKKQLPSYTTKKNTENTQSKNIPAFFNDLTFSESGSNTNIKKTDK